MNTPQKRTQTAFDAPTRPAEESRTESHINKTHRNKDLISESTFHIFPVSERFISIINIDIIVIYNPLR